MYEMYQNLGTSRSRSRAPSPDNWYREANDEAENPPFRSFFSVFKERRERERSLGRRCDQTRDDEREHGRSRVEGNKIDDGFQRGRSTVRTEKGSKDRLRSKSRGPPRQVGFVFFLAFEAVHEILSVNVKDVVETLDNFKRILYFHFHFNDCV